MYKKPCIANNWPEQTKYLTKCLSKCGDCSSLKENKTPWAYRAARKLKCLKKSPQLHLCEQLNRELRVAASKSCYFIEDIATEWYRKQKETRTLQIEQRKCLSSPCLDIKPNIREMAEAKLPFPSPSKDIKPVTYISPEFQEILRQHDERVRERCALNGLPREYIKRRKRKKKQMQEEPVPQLEQEVNWKTICSCEKIVFQKVLKKCQDPSCISQEENLTCCGLCQKSKQDSKKAEEEVESKKSCCGLCSKKLDKPEATSEDGKEDEVKTRFCGLCTKKPDKAEAKLKKPLEKEKDTDEIKTRFCGLCTEKPSKTDTKSKDLTKEKTTKTMKKEEDEHIKPSKTETKAKNIPKEKPPKPMEKEEDENVKCCGLCKKKMDDNKTDTPKPLPPKPVTPTPSPVIEKPEKLVETTTPTKESKSRFSNCFKCFQRKETPPESIEPKEEIKILPTSSEDLRPRYINFKNRSSQIPNEEEEGEQRKVNLTPRVHSNKEKKSYDASDFSTERVIELVKPQFQRGSRKSKERVKGGAYAIKRVTSIRETTIDRYRGGALKDISEQCTCAKPQEIWTKTQGTQTLELYFVQGRSSLDSGEVKRQAHKSDTANSGYRRSSLGSYDSLPENSNYKTRSSFDVEDIRKTKSSLDSKVLDHKCECAGSSIDSREKRRSSYNSQQYKNECTRSSIDPQQRKSSACKRSPSDSQECSCTKSSQECTKPALLCECTKSTVDSSQQRPSYRRSSVDSQECTQLANKCECPRTIDSKCQRNPCPLQSQSTICSLACQEPSTQCQCKNILPVTCFRQPKQKPKYLSMQGLVSSYWQHHVPYPLPKSKPKPKKKTLLCECKKSQICDASTSNVTVCSNNMCRQSRSSGGNYQGLITGERLVGFGNYTTARTPSSICTQQICKALQSSNQIKCPNICPNTPNICDCSPPPLSCIFHNSCNCSRNICSPPPQICPHLNKQNVCTHPSGSQNVCNCSRNISSPPPCSCNCYRNICSSPPNICSCPRTDIPQYSTEMCTSPYKFPSPSPPIDTQRYTSMYDLNETRPTKSMNDIRPLLSIADRGSQMYDKNKSRSTRISSLRDVERLSKALKRNTQTSNYSQAEIRASRLSSVPQERFSNVPPHPPPSFNNIKICENYAQITPNACLCSGIPNERFSKSYSTISQAFCEAPQQIQRICLCDRDDRLSTIPQSFGKSVRHSTMPIEDYDSYEIDEFGDPLQRTSYAREARISRQYRMERPSLEPQRTVSWSPKMHNSSVFLEGMPAISQTKEKKPDNLSRWSKAFRSQGATRRSRTVANRRPSKSSNINNNEDYYKVDNRYSSKSLDNQYNTRTVDEFQDEYPRFSQGYDKNSYQIDGFRECKCSRPSLISQLKECKFSRPSLIPQYRELPDFKECKCDNSNFRQTSKLPLNFKECNCNVESYSRKPFKNSENFRECNCLPTSKRFLESNRRKSLAPKECKCDYDQSDSLHDFDLCECEISSAKRSEEKSNTQCSCSSDTFDERDDTPINKFKSSKNKFNYRFNSGSDVIQDLKKCKCKNSSYGQQIKNKCQSGSDSNKQRNEILYIRYCKCGKSFSRGYSTSSQKSNSITTDNRKCSNVSGACACSGHKSSKSFKNLDHSRSVSCKCNSDSEDEESAEYKCQQSKRNSPDSRECKCSVSKSCPSSKRPQRCSTNFKENNGCKCNRKANDQKRSSYQCCKCSTTNSCQSNKNNSSSKDRGRTSQTFKASKCQLPPTCNCGTSCKYDTNCCTCNEESSDDDCKCNFKSKRESFQQSKDCKRQNTCTCYCDKNRNSYKEKLFGNDEKCKCSLKRSTKTCQQDKLIKCHTTTCNCETNHNFCSDKSFKDDDECKCISKTSKDYEYQTSTSCQCKKECRTCKTNFDDKSIASFCRQCDKERKSCTTKFTDNECKSSSKQHKVNNSQITKELAKSYYPTETKASVKIGSQCKAKSYTEFDSSKNKKRKSAEINNSCRSLPNSTRSSIIENSKTQAPESKKQSRILNCLKFSKDKKSSLESLEQYQKDKKENQECCTSSSTINSSRSSISNGCQESAENVGTDSNNNKFCTCDIKGHISENSLEEIVLRRRRSKGGSSATEEVKKPYVCKKKIREIKQKHTKFVDALNSKPKVLVWSHPKSSKQICRQHISKSNPTSKNKRIYSISNTDSLSEENILQKPMKSKENTSLKTYIKNLNSLGKKPFKTLEFVTKVDREGCKKFAKKKESLGAPLQEIFLNNRQRSKGGSQDKNKNKETQGSEIKLTNKTCKKSVKRFIEQGKQSNYKTNDENMSILESHQNRKESLDKYTENYNEHYEYSSTSMQENLLNDRFKSIKDSALNNTNSTSQCILSSSLNTDRASSSKKFIDHNKLPGNSNIKYNKDVGNSKTLIQEILCQKQPSSEKDSLEDFEIERQNSSLTKKSNEPNDESILYSPKYSLKFSLTSIRNETPCNSNSYVNIEEYSSHSDPHNSHSQPNSLITLYRSKSLFSSSIQTKKSNDLESESLSSSLEANNSQISRIAIKARELISEENGRNKNLESSNSLSSKEAMKFQDSGVIEKEWKETVASFKLIGEKDVIYCSGENVKESSLQESNRNNDQESFDSSKESLKTQGSQTIRDENKKTTKFSLHESIRKNLNEIESSSSKENYINTQRFYKRSESEISSSSIQCKIPINRKRYKGGATENTDAKKSQENITFLEDKHTNISQEQNLPIAAEHTASADKAIQASAASIKNTRKCRNLSMCCTGQRSTSSDSGTTISSKKSNPLLLCCKDSLCCTVCHRKKKLPHPSPPLPPPPPPPKEEPPKKCKFPLRPPGAPKFRALANVSPQHLHCFKDSYYWSGITSNYPKTYQDIGKTQQLEREHSAARRKKLWGNKCPRAQPVKAFYEAKHVREISPRHRKCFDIQEEYKKLKKIRFTSKSPCPCKKHDHNCIGEQRAKSVNLKTCPCHQKKEIWKTYSLSSIKSNESFTERKVKTKSSNWKNKYREEHTNIDQGIKKSKLTEQKKEDQIKNLKAKKPVEEIRTDKFLNNKHSEQSLRDTKIKAIVEYKERGRSKVKHQENERLTNSKESNQRTRNSKKRQYEYMESKERNKEEESYIKLSKTKKETDFRKVEIPSKIMEDGRRKSRKKTNENIYNIKEKHPEDIKSKDCKRQDKDVKMNQEIINKKMFSDAIDRGSNKTEMSSKVNVKNSTDETKTIQDSKSKRRRNQSLSNMNQRDETRATRSKDQKNEKDHGITTKSKESNQNLENNDLDDQVTKRRKRSASLNIFKRFSRT